MRQNILEQDIDFMQRALELAHKAQAVGEVPIGAVLVRDGNIIAEGYNQPISTHDPSAHAEMIALREGAKVLNNYRLLNTTLYVTLEPCVMCAGALVHARVERLVFGAKDPKAGAVCSVMQVLDHQALNHRVDWESGVLANPCGALLQTFFKSRR